MFLKVFERMFVSRVKSSDPNASNTDPESTVTNNKTELCEEDLNKDAEATPYFGKHSLHVAIKNNCPGIVDLLLNGRADVNVRNSEDMTPLHVASMNGQLLIVQKLLDYGACVKSVISETKSHPGYTPLHCAVEAGSQEITELLLKRNACVNARTKNGWTPLDIAVSLAVDSESSVQPIARNNENLIKVLLQHGAEIDSSYACYAKRSFHMRTCSTSQPTIVAQIFVSLLSDYNMIDRTTFLDAVDASKTEYNETTAHVMKRCTSVFLDMVSDRWNSLEVFLELILHAAVEIGCLRVVEDFLNFGIDANVLGTHEWCEKGFTLLHAAVNNKRHDIAKLLLNHGANVNAKDKDRRTPIVGAIENNDRTMTKLLLSKGACIKACPYLTATGEKVSWKLFEMLLQDDVDIDAKDENGNTVLHSLTVEKDDHYLEQHCECGQIVKANVATRLLIKGAAVDARNNAGLMPLHVAAKNGYLRVVEVLLQYNEGVDSATNNCFLRPFKPKHSSGRRSVKKVSINVKNREGKTPLHLASEYDREAVVKTLLAYGADIDAKDHCGKMAIDLAFAGGCKKAFVALLKYGSHFDSVDSNEVIPQRWKSMDDQMSLYRRFITNTAYCNYVIQQHVLQMETARRFTRKERQDLDDDCEITLWIFRDQCEKEIEEMEREKISGNVSFRDIVTSDAQRLAMYAGNEKIVRALNSKDYKEKFPIYSNMIECQFRRGLRRQSLLNRSLSCFDSTIANSVPHDVLTADIFGYLRNDDLENFIEACEG